MSPEMSPEMSRDTPGSAANRLVWSVSRLNLEVRALLESNLGQVWVEGEISNLARPRSGHIYFTLKDGGAQVRCAMFKSRMRGLDFAPENGLAVVVRARVGLYAERGDYQLVVDHMEEAGAGELRRAFEQLKARLGAEGLFDTEKKQPLPALPQTIGVITSPTGAAVRDIISTLKRRYPAATVIVYPVPVQGDAAAPAIEAALRTAAARNECDVLIVARGGGSLEDLWAFNEERTARAIAACPLPVISAVGHEVDFTIADFVADQRAPTPTGAAEMVSPDSEELLRRVGDLRRRVERQWSTTHSTARQYLNQLTRRLRHPASRLEEMAQRLDALNTRAERAMRTQGAAREAKVASLVARLRGQRPTARLHLLAHQHQRAVTALQAAMAVQLRDRRQRLSLASKSISTMGPQATLDRGYAILSRVSDDTIVRSAEEVSSGEVLSARVACGDIKVKVT
jgi:exodeoxyribonuclease VII large subunit